MMSLLFLAEIGFSQNYVTYSPQTKTIDVNSGAEGTVDVLVNCYGSTSDPVFLNALQSCANNDGILSTSYTNGSILTPGQNTTIRYKFKKTVTADTQIAYKFSTDGSCFQADSKMIKITVNYKAAPATSITNNIISGNQTVFEGQSANAISGSNPSGGNGTFTYSWQKKKVGDGAYSIISGATGINYSPGILAATTSFKRSVTSAGLTNTSAEITVTVTPPPFVQNNIISIDGVIVTGSLPTGGIGSYQYSWYVIDQDGDSSQLPDTSQNLILTPATFNRYFNSPNNFILKRMITSGNQYAPSNGVPIPHNSLVGNNTITLNGSTVDGTVPTGGLGAHSYQYSWYVIDQDGDGSELPDTSQNLVLTPATFNRYFNSPKDFILKRMVTSGNQYAPSNGILLPHNPGLIFKSSNNEEALISTVYPNPTSDAVNFTTSSSSNQEMEIIVYSEGLRNAQSVFKGTATPNQIIKWNIPSNYPKGIYFYKIISDNKEVKSGKISYQ
ncbi:MULTISPECIES: T9SS type A sorting domain-containing protein [unclassified Flavobacterium]|uniref:T9SS type A sorting domain-containing protein n=1 Tax=unclassified Flavobacterium TaxID=196869 RepID=UPI00131462E7|nr:MULTISPECIES: T9SS type A sorting domain-containing protein [unclassified Flavobacterium]